MAEFVSVDRGEGGVAVVRLDRPRMNALSTQLLEELLDAAGELTEDPPGAVVIWGGERIFAAGAEISEFDGPEEASVIGGKFRAALDAVAAIPRATIAAVTGYALGGGCELALACDFRVAADNAKFGQPEILLGIIPGGGGTQRLARLIGPAKAKDLIFTGRQVGAEEALRIGLADRVVPADQVFAEATAWATELARGAVVGQALAKDAIDRGLERELGVGLTIEQEHFVEVFRTADAKTGVASFLANGPGKAEFSGGS
ncbi:MAG TPA: enoyl-CoA hydratase-related protein [Acidimicrobiales bacterium]|nr:enoyl-CoA hydratase-related protein [Acidimicrobiales bacterium]